MLGQMKLSIMYGCLYQAGVRRAGFHCRTVKPLRDRAHIGVGLHWRKQEFLTIC